MDASGNISQHDAPKKQRELKAIQTLQEVYADFPAGDIEPGEEPDFRVRSGSRCLGIEVTEYFRPLAVSGSPLQEQEALASQIANRATEECIQRSAPAVLASVTFSPSSRLTKKDVSPLATTLTDLIIQAPEIQWSYEADYSSLPDKVDSLVIYRPPGLKEAVVTNTAAAFIPVLDETEIERNVQRKEKKLAAYRQGCSEVWLLIVVDGFRVSSIAELPNSMAQVASAFDRVIVLHAWNTAVEIG